MSSNLTEQFNQKRASWDLSARPATWPNEQLSLISNLDWQRPDRHRTPSCGLLTVPQGKRRAGGRGWSQVTGLTTPPWSWAAAERLEPNKPEGHAHFLGFLGWVPWSISKKGGELWLNLRQGFSRFQTKLETLGQPSAPKDFHRLIKP